LQGCKGFFIAAAQRRYGTVYGTLFHIQFAKLDRLGIEAARDRFPFGQSAIAGPRPPLDANMSVWKDDVGDTTTLHWPGKFVGSAFRPIQFELVPVELDQFVDCRVRTIPYLVKRIAALTSLLSVGDLRNVCFHGHEHAAVARDFETSRHIEIGAHARSALFAAEVWVDYVAATEMLEGCVMP
jgi:hypothetical protein